MSEEEIIEKYHHFKIKNADGIELDLIETKYYKELLDLYNKEKEKNDNLNWYFENQKDNFIPKSKIEEKIEELNNKMAEQLYIIKEFGEIKGNREKLTMYKEQRDILAELLEEE